MPDQFFVAILGPHKHGLVCCQPSIIKYWHYYHSQRTGDLRRRTAEKEAHTIVMLDLQYRRMLKNMQGFMSQFTASLNLVGMVPLSRMPDVLLSFVNVMFVIINESCLYSSLFTLYFVYI